MEEHVLCIWHVISPWRQ